ncbi:MAG: 50S ribosomal protein L4 [Bacteroidales bacterium]|nr:50S ribosomal protein L4 [Bacteroidales bacterium]
MEVAVYNIKGQDTGRKITLNDEVFAYTSGNEANPEHVVYLDVKQYLANQRQGTHKSKERSEVSGSTRKLGRQKGGGGARRGDINSPVLIGGGRVFGPKPRDYRFKINKKVKGLARKLALTAKAQNNEIIVVENFTFEAPKTKNYMDLAKNLKIDDKKVLLVLSEANKNVYLSVRNVANAKTIVARELNTYAILNNNALVLTEDSVNQINEL